MRIVSFVGMREDAVGQRRLHRAAAHRRTGNSADRVSAICPYKLDRELSRRQAGAGDHGGERVENHELCFLEDGFRQRARRRSGHERAERRHHVAHFGRLSELTGGLWTERGARKQRAGGLQQLAAADDEVICHRRLL